MHLLPGEVVKFLMASRFCQSDQFEPFVMAEFGSLSGGPRVAVMRDWIETNVAYVHGTSTARTPSSTPSCSARASAATSRTSW